MGISMDSNNNNNNNSNTDSDTDNDIPELENIPEPEPVEETNNPFTENIIINDDAITDLFIRMFNNPRFTNRASYYYPVNAPPVTLTRSNNNDDDNNQEDNNDQENNNSEQRTREQAEAFITNLTNLIARPNLNTMRYRNPTLSRRRFEQLLMQSFNQKPKYKKVLSEEGEEQLKKMLYKDSSKTNESCPIYYVDFEDDSEVIELPCKHCFTPAGIEKW